MKTKMIVSVRRAPRFPPITKDSEIPSHFLTNDAESNNNRVKSVKKHTQSGFNGTIEAVRRLANTEIEEFSQAITGVSADYEVRKEFQKYDKKSVWRGPPTSDGKPTFPVASFSQGRPNYVVMDRNTGRVECECENWKSLKICSHALAVAEREDTLHKYLEFYSKQPVFKKRNFTKVSNLDVNVGLLGRKGRCARKRSNSTPSATVTALARQQSSPTTCTKYTLKWLIESKAYQCYGCNSAIRVPGHVPAPPEDVVAATKEYRSFTKNGKL